MPVLPTPDRWLDRWMPLISDKAVAQSILEVGCGDGDDTETLCAAGYAVQAIDVDPAAVEKTQLRVPEAQVFRRDVRTYFDGYQSSFDVIVASLSLHYFRWQETRALVARIHHALRPGGVLLCRLNATDDHHYGATGHPTIEPNFYNVNGQPKRFFDGPSILLLFAEGWQIVSMQHQHCHRYGMPKALWEVVLERQVCATPGLYCGATRFRAPE